MKYHSPLGSRYNSAHLATFMTIKAGSVFVRAAWSSRTKASTAAILTGFVRVFIAVTGSGMWTMRLSIVLLQGIVHLDFVFPQKN